MMDIFRPGKFDPQSDEIVFSDSAAGASILEQRAIRDADWLRLSFDPHGNGIGVAFAGDAPIGRVAVTDFMFGREAVLWNLPYKGMLDHSVLLIVDLPQDFGIFLPILVRLQALSIPAHLVVSKKFLGRPMADQQVMIYRHLTRSISIVDDVHELRRVLPTGIRTVLCASESSVSGHRFCHSVLEGIPAEAVKITFQHGFENIGLMHAPSHSDAYGEEVVFRSDIIGVWGDPASYPDVTESQRGKLISIGFTRSFCPGRVPLGVPSTGRNGRKRVMVAENLHSLRFDASLRDAFIAFVGELAERYDVVIKPHPGGAYSVKNAVFPNLPKVEGALTWDSFKDIDFVVTPPSSIVFDAIVASIPVYIWSPSDRHSYNYADLLCDGFSEFRQQIEKSPRSRIMAQWEFFYRHVSSVSGVENFFRKLL